MESAFYGFSRYAEAGLDGFSCPVLMTSDETGTISLSVSNKTDRVLTPSIKTDISTPILRLEIDEKIELAPGESKKLTWSVGPDNIDLGHFIFAKAMVYSVYPIANQEATCGIYILDLPGSGRVILLILVLRHAMAFAAKIAGPIAAVFPGHKIAGVAVATIIAALVLLLLSFVAGLFARTHTGRNLARWLEDSLLGNLPQYRMVKTMAEGLAQIEDANNLRPAMVSIEGGWQLGYLLEEDGTGWVAVFLPQAPTPMSGNVMYMPAERVGALDMPMLPSAS